MVQGHQSGQRVPEAGAWPASQVARSGWDPRPARLLHSHDSREGPPGRSRADDRVQRLDRVALCVSAPDRCPGDRWACLGCRAVPCRCTGDGRRSRVLPARRIPGSTRGVCPRRPGAAGSHKPSSTLPTATIARAGDGFTVTMRSSNRASDAVDRRHCPCAGTSPGCRRSGSGMKIRRRSSRRSSSAGLTRDASDLNPLKVFRPRK